MALRDEIARGLVLGEGGLVIALLHRGVAGLDCGLGAADILFLAGDGAVGDVPRRWCREIRL